MNGELLNVLEYLEREKGIKREILIRAIETSLLSASRKSLGAQKNASITIDAKTGDIRVYNKMVVVEKATHAKEELSLEEAKHFQMNVKIGDVIDVEVTPKDFGRIAAQTAKQVIIQKLREAEKEIIFNEYRERQGELVTGLIRRYERGAVIVDLGKCEAMLPPREQAPTEKYPLGSRLRAYIVEVKDGGKSLEIILSRTHPGFLSRLFELEVPEISEGIVTIKAVAREAGFRSKVAVHSNSERVDGVGACVGMRGERIKNIVRELNGERIDIVPWNSSQAVFVANALSPAKLKKVTIVEEEKKAEVIVEPDQLSLAIGRKGQNARLCAKLTGFRIDIMAERMPTAVEGGAEKAADAVVYTAGEQGNKPLEGLALSNIRELEEGVLRALKQTGYRMAEEVLRLSAVDLSKVVGLEEAQAVKVLETISSALKKANGEKVSTNEGA